MKRMIPILLALAAGCVTVPRPGRPIETPREDSPAEREAKEVVRGEFERLMKAWLEGDGMTALRLMSVQGISDWVFERTKDASDAEWSRRISALDAGLKVELDHWRQVNRRVQVPYVNDRPSTLPESLLTSKWLVETWKRYFDLEKENLKQISGVMEISEIYVDGTEASVLVKMGKTPARIYSMVQGGDGFWKFAYVVRPAPRVKSQ